jgi:hypothetical protein
MPRHPSGAPHGARLERWELWRAMREQCAACGGVGVHILYGRLNQPGVLAERAGDVFYGGRAVKHDSPLWRCQSCRTEWGHARSDLLYEAIVTGVVPADARRPRRTLETTMSTAVAAAADLSEDRAALMHRAIRAVAHAQRLTTTTQSRATGTGTP